MIKQINNPRYWNDKWSTKKTGGNYGQNQYYFLAHEINLKESFTCLDLGCGRGAGVGWLTTVFPEAKFLGIDFAETAIEAAGKKFKKNKNLSFKCGDIYKMDFDFQSFDYILMIELLEHLRWPGKMLGKFVRLCNKTIYISIPSTNWQCDEHLYAYGKKLNPFESFGAELIGNINGRKKLKIEVNNATSD